MLTQPPQHEDLAHRLPVSNKLTTDPNHVVLPSYDLQVDLNDDSPCLNTDVCVLSESQGCL